MVTRQSADAADEDPALRRLMADYQAGSGAAFDALHDALAPELRAYLLRLSRDGGRADDLLQDTFLLVHRHRAAHEPGTAVRPWLFAIAKRVFLMHRRAAGRRQHYEDRASDARATDVTSGDQVDRLHARRQVTSALRAAPAGGRRVFVWHHLLGWSFKDIGARLGITSAAAKVRSGRAARVMRHLLREDRDE